MTDCPCSSGSAYDACCGPLHRGERGAATAEALMRSRYAAFVRAEIEYLRTSTHPEMRGDFDADSVRQWATTADWQGFEVLRVDSGGPEDASGIVEFVAHYAVEGNPVDHHEVSEFRREDGQWFFFDGKEVPVTVRREEPKIGRNDPCSCGSGKKFKKCCGRA